MLTNKSQSNESKNIEVQNRQENELKSAKSIFDENHALNSLKIEENHLKIQKKLSFSTALKIVTLLLDRTS